ncbi:MAG: DUF2868 domain-containing protein [Hyphomicrobiales bacterium]|nr:DUF2868 domain-containing protein [Hyphomicrobiales bacterium]MCP5373327.1 DUF2868 domain-containing protein [Hyphomicrobiales bacterium]
MPSAPPASSATDPADFDGRLLAMAVRVLEGGRAAPFDEPAAEDLARRADGDFEHRLVVRARALPVAAPLGRALARLRRILGLVAGGAAVVAAAGGAATAQAALTGSVPVNFPVALLGLLGVHLIALVLWLVLMVVMRGAAVPTSLGGMVAAVARRLAVRGSGGDGAGDGGGQEGNPEAVMVRTAGAVLARGAIGRWTLGAISHGLWLAFMAGALAAALLVLSTRQVSFTWETTILSADTYVPATRAIAVLPRLAGFPVPTDEQVRAGRWTGQAPPSTAGAEAWSGLLVGAVVVYGAVPRLVLLLLCWGLRALAVARFRLDLALPGFLRLRERLLPSVRREGVVDPDTGGAEAAPPAIEAVPVARVDGPVAALALETAFDPGHWPPPVAGVAWLDLGGLDGRDDLARARARLQGEGHCLLLAAVSLLSTPDRGMAAALAALHRASGAPLVLVLADGARLRARLDAATADQRLEDWRALAVRVGVAPEWALEYDPAAADGGAGRARLARLLGGEAA